MKTYLKHSSPPMPGDCLTPLVESWTLNLFPFSSAPCNSRSKSLIFPRPGNKWLIVFWNGLLTHPSINVDKAKVFICHNIGLDNSAIALKQRPEFGKGYIVWFKLTMIWVSRAFTWAHHQWCRQQCCPQKASGCFACSAPCCHSVPPQIDIFHQFNAIAKCGLTFIFLPWKSCFPFRFRIASWDADSESMWTNLQVK